MQYLSENHKTELKASAIDEELMALNFKTYREGYSQFENLFMGLEESDRRNDGRVRDSWLSKYNHCYNGGWWCQTLRVGDWDKDDWGVFKPDTPRHDNHGKIIKYESPPKQKTKLIVLELPLSLIAKVLDSQKIDIIPMVSSNSDFWSLVVEHRDLPILLTEGSKKTASVLSQGFICIGASGVWNYTANQNLIEGLEQFAVEKRPLYIVFDQDSQYKTRKAVFKATCRLCDLLIAKGCVIKICQWDNKRGKGIDDYVSGGGTIEHLIDTAIDYETYIENFTPKVRRIKLEEVLEIIEGMGDDLRFNQLSDEIEYKGTPFVVEEGLRAYFVKKFGVDSSLNNWEASLSYVARENSYDPVLDYLQRVHFKYEGEDFDISNISSRYFGTDDPLYDTFLYKWLISAVARTYEPGCKVDTCLVLQGEQGQGKSQFFEVLVGRDFFDSSIIDITTKDSLVLLSKCWVHELAEIENVTKKKEVGQIKAWLSRSTDNFRKPYTKNPVSYKRRSVVVGTVNQDSFLVDETGNRRFWVVPLARDLKVNLKRLASERDRIWAAAVSEYKAGQQWWLDADEEKRQMSQVKEYTLRPVWYDMVEDYLLGRTQVTTREIMENVFGLDHAELFKINHRNLPKCLIELGCKKLPQKRIAGKKCLPYSVPPHLAAPIDEEVNGHQEQDIIPKPAVKIQDGKAVIDFATLIDYTDKQMERLGMTKEAGVSFLRQKFNKTSRHVLSDGELIEFANYLESL